MSVNRIILLGRIGQKAELKQSQNGNAYTRFSVATTENYKGNSTTTWHNVTAFGKTAEVVCEYTGVGSEVFVEGKMDYSKKDDKQYANVIASSVQLVGPKRDYDKNDHAAAAKSVGW